MNTVPQEEVKTPETPSAMLPVTDLNTFVQYLVGWHTSKVAMLNHMREIPEGTEVSTNDDAPVALSGDIMKGFQMGLIVALAEMGTLPFVAEVDEDEVGEAVPG